MSLATLTAVVPRPPIPPIRTREDLIDTLSMAAEIEHAIMCQYLYAAFSLDRANPALSPEHTETVRTFAIEMLKIARQEMEHLGIVMNLLISVGAAPDLDRPNLPLQPNYYAIDLPFGLMPFGDAFLALAAQLEKSAGADPLPPLPYYPTVAAIYDRLRDGFVRLARELPQLFCGANQPQVSNADFGVAPNQVWYDLELLPVTDLPSALAAIDLIRIQGEGTTIRDPDSHYAIVKRCRAMWDALEPHVRRAMVRPVPSNPMTRQRGDVDPRATCCVFSDPRAVALGDLLNRTYELLLLLLARLYGANDATAADRDMYRHNAFFPLMTIVVRPVAECMVDLPAGDGIHCAAVPFEIDLPIRTFPERTSFHLQLGERLSHLAAGYAAVAAMDDVPPRLAFVAKNVAYVRDRVLAYIGGGS